MTPAPTPAARPPHALLLDATSADLESVPDTVDADTRSGRGARLRCRACGAAITDEGQRRSVDGSHAHTRANPSGMRYTFGCFREAPGCRCLGVPTDEHTWFAGCRWRIAACGACGEHLGWAYTGADAFYGLILARLAGEKEQ